MAAACSPVLLAPAEKTGPCSPFTPTTLHPRTTATHLQLLLNNSCSPASKSFTICSFHTSHSPCPDTPPSSSSSLYQILQIPQSASQSEVKSSYKRLARIYHPDARIHHAASATLMQGNTCTEEEREEDNHYTRIFLQIHEAYVALSDRESRARYDAQLAAAQAQRKHGFRGRSLTRVGGNWESDQCW